MDLSGQRIALYGRFLTRARSDLARLITDCGGTVERDLTRRTTMLVVGRAALSMIPSGHLSKHIATAAGQATVVVGEDRLADLMDGKEDHTPTYPLSRVTPELPDGLAPLLNAFDLVHATPDACRFADVEVLRSALNLIADGHEMSSVVRILIQAQAAPPGRYKILTDTGGEVRLDWGDSITGLDGQGLLPLPDHPDLDDLFDAALLAEAEGRLNEAARAYDLCAQMDRRDPIAPFNLSNVLMRQGNVAEAVTRLDQAIARDPGFSEAWFNRAKLEEERGNHARAKSDLVKATLEDPTYGEAIFNLAQLELQVGEPTEAVLLLDRFLRLEPSAHWVAVANKLKSVARAQSVSLRSNDLSE